MHVKIISMCLMKWAKKREKKKEEKKSTVYNLLRSFLGENVQHRTCEVKWTFGDLHFVKWN